MGLGKFEWGLFGILIVIAVILYAFPQTLLFPDVGAFVEEREPLTTNALLDLARLTANEVTQSGASTIIIEFTDFECPFCAQSQELLAVFRDNPSVLYLHRHFPLTAIHANAVGAAHIYECAVDAGKGDIAREMLFASYDELGDEAFTRILDTLAIPVCVSFGERIEHDAVLAKYFRASGTPTFVVIPVDSPESYVVVEGADISQINALINANE